MFSAEVPPGRRRVPPRGDDALPGRPQKVMHGDLGDGVVGYLVLWLDTVVTQHCSTRCEPRPAASSRLRP